MFPKRSMLFSTSVMDGVVTVSVIGPTVRERHVPALLGYLAEVADEHDGRVVVSMSGARSFTCSWLNALVALSRRCRHLGGRLVVTGLTRETEKLLRESGLDQHLSITRDQGDARMAVECASIAPWRLAVARLLSIPVAAA
jgi:anti-anti-sigma factor